tara:strand:- start:3909 stop:5408 length:1500 start_codon:yes stop_codon:yes gene_type:complete
MTQKKTVGIVGGGPGGLMAAMLLSSRGLDVTLYERSNQVGGRCGKLEKGEYSWDIGPTFLMYKELLEECFSEAGASLSEQLDLVRLDPMYQLFFSDKNISIFPESAQTEVELEKHFPGARPSFRRFRDKERKRFESLRPLLQKDFSRKRNYLSWEGLKALPHLGLGSSVFRRLRDHFTDEDLSLAFSFQSKYLGMSAWDCPSMFSIIPHLEHEYGVYHVMGGLYRINQAMAETARRNGAKIHTSTPVREIIVEGGRATGLLLDDSAVKKFDHVVVNADFAFAVKNLIRNEFLNQYKHERIERMKYSCSTYMLYLGLKGKTTIPFHSIVFARDYKRNVREIFETGTLSQDLSFYVRNASQIDPNFAPKGNSALYVLVPVPNLKQYDDWDRSADSFRELVFREIQVRLGLSNLKSRIEEEVIITPQDWERRMNVQYGATFNLSHSWDQLAMFRPHNAFNDINKLYLVGGGTHPGSGLPTIYESGRIATKLILQNEGYHYDK